MRKAKETPICISANESLHDAITSISNGNKDKKLFDVNEKPRTQDRILKGVFSDGIMTMRQASIKTGIDRANICRFVSRQREKDAIWRCERKIDRTSGAKAGFLTTNLERAVRFFSDATIQFWHDLPVEEQGRIHDAIDSYLKLSDSGVFLTSSFSDNDNTLASWLNVQGYIDACMRGK